MTIKHILKNGKQVESIAGTVIRRKEFPELYAMLDKMQKGFVENGNLESNKRTA